ncbi:MAG: G5 domain-containing protein [Anaerolineaceae bacterium]|nr:G5 domain-containing protein [Anaerolineaceae bacterium]
MPKITTVNCTSISPKRLLFALLLSFMLTWVTACNAGGTSPQSISVTVNVDGKQSTIQVSVGTTVQAALQKAAISMSDLDRVDPPSYTPLTADSTIKVTRVKESFEVVDNLIPFSRQTVRNESLPEGQTLMIQPGVNGDQQITYRKVTEDGVEVSRSPIKTVVIKDAMPEIVMVGVQTPFTAVPITGNLVYLTSSNAWIMENTTGNRRPLVSTGDLDGHIFTLSQDGKWLLYSRKSKDSSSDVINSLWVVDVTATTPKPVDLRVNNVINFADWVPGAGLTISYSTVEPRATAPGWQANNDLIFLTINPDGVILKKDTILGPNSGGIYGWWGTTFTWSSDGQHLAYARPDGVGLVDIKKNALSPLIDLIPLQTQSDWAWVPGLAWSPDNDILYTVIHSPKSGLSSDEASPLFDLAGIVANNKNSIDMIPQSGMFAYPEPSPTLPNKRFQVAFLQAIFPEQSETSRYRLVLMNRDGSNRRTIFPPDGAQGLDPQIKVLAWGPNPSADSPLSLGLIYQGNLWLVNVDTNQAQQITGDGSISRLDWK